jgi:hypothetical protein
MPHALCAAQIDTIAALVIALSRFSKAGFGLPFDTWPSLPINRSHLSK